jgi:hypothetical protein
MVAGLPGISARPSALRNGVSEALPSVVRVGLFRVSEENSAVISPFLPCFSALYDGTISAGNILLFFRHHVPVHGFRITLERQRRRT